MLLPRDQPLEAGIAPKRGEAGVEFEPAGRQVYGTLSNGLSWSSASSGSSTR